jgi:hypothetical protein
MADPDSAEGDDGKLRYLTLVDSARLGVWGVALVKAGFRARLHHHPQRETYYFLWGEGLMVIGDTQFRFSAPARVVIPADVRHAMTPVSTHVVLLYTFKPGRRFEDIPYTFDPDFVPVPNYPSVSYSTPSERLSDAELCRTSKL